MPLTAEQIGHALALSERGLSRRVVGRHVGTYAQDIQRVVGPLQERWDTDPAAVDRAYQHWRSRLADISATALAGVEPSKPAPKWSHDPAPEAPAPEAPAPESPAPTATHALTEIRALVDGAKRDVAEARAIGDVRTQQHATRTVATLMPVLARVEREAASRGDDIVFSRADIEQAEASLRARLEALAQRPLTCARCARELAIDAGEARRKLE